jgi:hypothetical protein
MRYDHLDMLPEQAFKPLGKRMTLEGGGKGGSKSAPPPPATQTVNQTNLPEYARPYFENLLKRTQAESYRDYVPYEAERIAGFTPQQQAIQQETLGLQKPTQFAQASQGLGEAQGMGLSAARAGLQGALGDTQQFMSPYIQGALDPQLRELQRQSMIQQRDLNLGSARQGTYGGARQAFLQSEIGRNTQRTMGDVLGRGYQTAYEQALARQGQLGQLGTSNLAASADISKGLGALGAAEQAANLERLQTQQGVAAQEQAMTQNQLDMAYQDFLRQRDYPQEQLGFYSNVLRGLPVQLASTQQTYQAAPNIASQIGGLGIAGLGLAKALG